MGGCRGVRHVTGEGVQYNGGEWMEGWGDDNKAVCYDSPGIRTASRTPHT